MTSQVSQGNNLPTHDIVANDALEKSASANCKASNEYSTAQNHNSEAVEEEAVDVSLPLNWPLGKKIYNMPIPSLLCLVGSLGISLYTPGIRDVMKDFHVSQTIATLPLTTFVLGLSFGPMISAPISETLGRLGTYRIALPLSMLFTLGAGFAQNITGLIILRFFAGLFAGAPFPVSAGTATDLVHPQNRAIAGIALLYPTFLGPAIGPIIGGFVAENKGWRWTQYVLAMFFGAAYIGVPFLSETYLKVILQKRKKVENKAGPPAKTLLLGVIFITLLRPIKMLLTEPIVMFLSIYVAFNFAVLFSFFASIPYVFKVVYGFDIGMSGLVFLAVAVGCTLSVPIMIILDRMIYQKKWKLSVQEGRTGTIAPEHRLWASMVGAVGMPIGLFWFGWSAKTEVHWIIPILAMVPYAFGNVCIYTTVCLYLIDTYQALTAASAIAANGLLRNILAATFPLLTIPMYQHLGIGWASSLLGFISISMFPIPFVLYKWGPQIRGRSKFETNEMLLDTREGLRHIFSKHLMYSTA